MQIKPFTINQAMRDTVANTLTLKAVSQAGPRIAADLAALNEQFWTQHCAKVEALPGLNKKHWAELIQAGALSATSTAGPTHEVLHRNHTTTYTESFTAAAHYYKDEARNGVVDRVLNSASFQGVKHYLTTGRHERGWTVQFVSPAGSVPRLHGMERIADADFEQRLIAACTELEAVMSAAVSFRAQTMDVLLACRTSRQVEDLFPEAAKLLPQPVKNEKALAPTELAASVRAMLEKGVPPVTANA